MRVESRRLTFREIRGCNEATKIRRFETKDIVERLGVISPNRIHLNNYPIDNPITIFNASLTYEREEDQLILYSRIILGYYMYVSSIVEVRVPLQDAYNRSININHYIGEIAVYPTTQYDIWGAEDPRVYRIDDDLYMTYTGRTINYFNPAVRRDRTLPVTAVYDRESKAWRKSIVFTLSPRVFGTPISNKDAYVYETAEGKLLLFHRPHLEDESFRLMLSWIEDLKEVKAPGDIRRVEVDNGLEALKCPGFEERMGWATPPIPIGRDRVVVLVHGVDRVVQAYRVFAVQLSIGREEVTVDAVTPHYIMEPRANYEVIGDRPLVVFPCGAVKIGEDDIIVSYGAADYMVGLGLISLNELLGELDKGRIF